MVTKDLLTKEGFDDRMYLVSQFDMVYVYSAINLYGPHTKGSGPGKKKVL